MVREALKALRDTESKQAIDKAFRLRFGADMLLQDPDSTEPSWSFVHSLIFITSVRVSSSMRRLILLLHVGDSNLKTRSLTIANFWAGLQTGCLASFMGGRRRCCGRLRG